MTFIELCTQRQLMGIRQYRGGDASRPFSGDPCEEVKQEVADAFNYLKEAEAQHGANLVIFREMMETVYYAMERVQRSYPRTPARSK